MRLFLALMPSPALLETMEGIQWTFREKAPGCRPLPSEKLHMTLRFEGWAGEREKGLLEEKGDRLATLLGHRAIPTPSPALVLDSRAVYGLGILTFAPEGPEPPPWRIVREYLGSFDSGRPFWPHVTLFRRFRPAHREALPLTERAPSGFSEIALYESLPGAGGSLYRPLRRWLLDPGNGSSTSPTESA